ILYSSKNSYFLLALTSNSAKSSNFFYLKMAMVIENIKSRQLLRTQLNKTPPKFHALKKSPLGGDLEGLKFNFKKR
ncbi:hypothetical protein, partial [Parafilimonas sp.]|uniref:hypothetical protein n=1 Tax=Parafilimonas sp. TaxID=1969739 RepID=UPI0039E3E0F1